jgi:TonB-dependent receptor
MKTLLPAPAALAPALGFVRGALAAVFVVTSMAFGAESAGRISGTVVNAATGSFLQGATVQIQGTGLTTHTDRSGRYELPNVPAGERVLLVSYTGLDSAQLTVNVAAGSVVSRAVELTSDVYQLDPFTVAGEREGSARAITAQRNAANIKTVVATEAFGNISDGNLGEFLKRSSGIATQLNEGEVDRIFVRGISAAYNAVTLDGTRLPSPGADKRDRSFEVDKLPADYIESIEVFKAPTPDMDADSIGGTVNLITKSAFDSKDRYLQYTFGLNHRTFKERTGYYGGLQYSDVIGAGDKLAVFYSFNYSEVDVPQSNAQTDYAPASPSWIFRFRIADNDHVRKRIGHGLKLEYRLGDSTTLFSSLMYNHYSDELELRRYTYDGRDNRAADYEPGFSELNTIHRVARYTVQGSWNQIEQETFQIQAGGRTRLQDWEFDYSASYAPATGGEDRWNLVLQTGRNLRYQITKDSINDWYPSGAQLSGPDMNNFNNVGVPALSLQDYETEESVWGGQLNVKRKLQTQHPAFLKTGVRWRAQKLSIQNEEFGAQYTGGGDRNQFTLEGYDIAPADGRYPLPRWPDAAKGAAHYAQNLGQWDVDRVAQVQDSLVGDGRVREDVYAAYVMGDVKVGKLGLLAGIRFEDTDVAATGSLQQPLATPAPAGATEEQLADRARLEFGGRQTKKSSYSNWFPGMHLRYEFRPGLIGRASWSTSIGRPNFGDIIPATVVDDTNLSVQTNNTGLSPQESTNFDVSLEYYFEPAGVFSVGLFHKDIKNFIFTHESTLGSGAGNGFDGRFEGYDLTTQLNGGSAEVKGIEFNYSQRLGQYANWLRGFSIYGNYTFIDAEGDYNALGGTPSDQLVEFVPNTWNAGIVFDRNRWTLRFQVNFNDRYLKEYVENPLARIYDEDRLDGEVSAKYAFSQKFAVFADITNAFDRTIVRSSGYGRYWPQTVRYNGSRINFGVSGRF